MIDDFSFLVPHASELPMLLKLVTRDNAPPAVETEFANQLKDFWINFANDLNPGSMFISILRLIDRAQSLIYLR